MSERTRGRTRRCSTADGRSRLLQARKFLEVAQITSEEGDEYPSVSASLAVLAGIAAADAACCIALGLRSRGQDHHQAEILLTQVRPGGSAATKHLKRLLDLKDSAHYGVFDVSGADLKSALRRASELVKFATKISER